MFQTMQAPPLDTILSILDLFRADTRADKLDLGVGVYKDEKGLTPILPSVRAAETRHLAEAVTKTYVGPAGNPRFVELVRDLAFGPGAPRERIGGVQTTGGSGALRILAALIAHHAPRTVVHVPDPSWVNHLAIMEDAGLRIASYRYLDAATGRLRIDAMLEDIGRMGPRDIILLHGCCHNPTGADPTPEEWGRIIAAISARGVVPFMDLAYQGFGEGLDADAASLRRMAAEVPELLLAYSCSKNFGIYRERAGAAFVLSASPAGAPIVRAQLAARNRVACSMPPDHGAALVCGVLDDPVLGPQWRDEVEVMRTHVARNRAALAAALAEVDGQRFATLGRQKGMFSRLPLSEAQVARLREEHAIYMVSDGRINLAGLDVSQAPRLARAVAMVL